MLLVETYLNISPGRGLGIFAKADIKKGTKYWVRNEVFDKVFSEEELETFPKLASDYIKVHGFQEVTRDWYLCGDNARFTNHQDGSNTKNHFDAQGIIQFSTASETIKAGRKFSAITLKYV